MATTDVLLPEVEDVDEGEDSPASLRPALRHLNKEQNEALEEFRDAGVETRRELLTWLLRLQYRTLGRVPDFWYYRVATDPAALAVVLTGENRGQFGQKDGTDISPSEAWKLRRRLVARALRPACRDAFRELRTSATEYLDEDRPDVDHPERMAPLALRPALDNHYQKQKDALDALLEGFDSLEELDRWLGELDDALYGAMKEVNRSYDYDIISDGLAQRCCVREGSAYRRRREELAARYILPATNVAVRTIVATAGESQETTSEHQGGVDL